MDWKLFVKKVSGQFSNLDLLFIKRPRSHYIEGVIIDY